jgi:predicted TPR repeat methyltransferase
MPRMKVRPSPISAAATVAAQATPQRGLAAELAAAVDHLRNERIDEAEPIFLRILERVPDQADALHFLGVLRHTQGRIDEAIGLIRQSLAALPNNGSAWNNLGNVQLLADRASEAAEAYAKAVEFSDSKGNEAPLALNNLGVLYRKLHRLDDSEAALRQSVERDPKFADGWYNLSVTLIKQGRLNEGLIAHAKAVALWPEQVQSRQEVIRSLLLLGEHERAGKLLREWLASDPGNPVAEHMLAACEAGAGSQPAPERASDGYVQQVFDGFAASFDAKLEALHYRAPELVLQALRAVVGEPAAALVIVDAGCGTGLCGPGLRPYARPSQLVGCDLSVGMLRRAQLRQCYDGLHQAELTHYLDTQPAAFDAVISADTLCYFGALERALAAAHRSLRPGGWLIFTVEGLPEGSALPHLLQANGRYAHAQAYLHAALRAADFSQIDLAPAELRLEAGEPVRGFVVRGRKVTAAADPSTEVGATGATSRLA